MVVKFSDFSGNACEIRLGTDTTSQSYVYAAPDSFVVEEESGNDVSVPVRTQSGNINIIDVEDDWTALLPTDGGVMPVYFYRGATCVWKGYVNSGTFGSPYLAVAPRVSIPVVCPLTMLNAVDFRPSLAIDTIANFLSDIFLQGDFQTIQLSYVIASQDATAITSLKIMGSTFYDVDSEGNYNPKYSCLEALQRLCTICGLTARWNGISVVLEGLPLAASNPTALTMPFSNDNQEQRILPGWRKVTVEPDEEEIDVVFDIPDRYIMNDVIADAGNITFNDYDQAKSDTANGVYIWIAGSFGGQNVSIELTSPSIVIEAPNLYPSNYGSSLEVFDRYKAEDPANPQTGKQSFQWTSVIDVWGAGNGSIQHEACIKISTVQEFAMSNGFLVFNAGILSAYETSNDVGALVCTLQVGDQYWAGESWVRYEMPFHIPYENGQIKNNRELSTVWGDYQGFGIFVGNVGISGTIVFTIYDVLRAPGLNPKVGLTNLKLEFVRKQDYSVNDDRKFIAENSAKFLNTKEVSTAYCSDNPSKTLSNVLLDANNVPVREIEIGQETITPEQWLADNLSDFGSTARHCLKLNMRGNLGNVADYSIGNKAYHCFAATHDYAEDSTTINLIEI